MTYRGLPADYDAWKTRSDRDNDWWNEPETEECMAEPADIAALVERLRTQTRLGELLRGTRDLCGEAADALEACQAENERLRAENADMALGPTMVQNQRAEIERLCTKLLDTQERLRIQRDLTDITAEQVRDVRVPARNAALEEAAQVAEGPINRQLYANDIGPFIAAAIRALKDKP